MDERWACARWRKPAEREVDRWVRDVVYVSRRVR